SRPVTPRPVNPNAKPAQPTPVPPVRPSPMPGLGGGTVQPPKPTPLPAIRPPANSNLRPSILPDKPDLPATRPGVNIPGAPSTGPAVRPIGERPVLPDRPGAGGGGVQWPSKPDILPAPIRPDPKRPIDPGRPINPNRPPITWPDRPNRPNRPDININ